jgi:hypothetical protein
MTMKILTLKIFSLLGFWVLGFWLLLGSTTLVFADSDDEPAVKSESHSLSKPAPVDQDDDDLSPAISRLAKTDQDEDDLSRGMAESINVDEAWIENNLFFFVFADNDFSAGHSLNFVGELAHLFDHNFGMELEFPQVFTLQPLGQAPAALGPIGLNLRYVYYQFGTEKSLDAGVFSVAAGGAYWATPDSRFPALGSSLTAEALAGWRHGRVFLQGNYGYSVNLNQNAFSGWMANTALGVNAGSQWVIQMEADYSSNAALDADDGISGNQWVIIPQVGFKAGELFFELGEQMNASRSGTTVLLIEREL